VLIAGIVEGVGKVEASAVAHPAAAEAEFVLVQDGDTLWGISERAYGNGARYTETFAANREVIEDPDLIFPGQKIRIPR
jgi:nucleoid-associated protein YgaU